MSNYSGYAILPIEVQFSDEDHGEWFQVIYDWTGRSDVYTDQQYMDNLVWSINEYGGMTATHTYTFLEFGSEYEIAAVVLDTEGQFSSLYRKWVAPTYDGCGDAADYVAWWDEYQESLNGGVGLQSVVLFEKKGQKGARVSQQSFEAKREVMAADEVIVRR